MGDKPPQYTAPPVDPAFTALQQQAAQDQITATQQSVQMDGASLMARYGTRLALANMSGAAPAVTPPAAAPPGAFGAT